MIKEKTTSNKNYSIYFRCSFWRANFELKDVNGNVVFTIIGPGCICDGPYSCCCENKFTVSDNWCLVKILTCCFVVIRSRWCNGNWSYS